MRPRSGKPSSSTSCSTSTSPRRRARTSSRIPWATTRSSRSRAGRFAPVAIGWSRPPPARSPKPSSSGSRRSCECGSPYTSRMRRSRRPLPASGSPSFATAKTMADKTMAEALVALGGNMGDVRDTLDRAIAAFCDGEKVRLLARSSDYRTPPWGVEDQPPFVNLCIAVETDLPPRDLLARAQAIERALGRERTRERRWGPRRVDIDLLTYDDLALQTADLSLPHPRLLTRAFVLAPLVEIRPQHVIAGIRIRDALAKVDISGIERLAPIEGQSSPG